MEVSTKDNSHSAVIARMQQRIDALEAAQPADLLALDDMLDEAAVKAKAERVRKLKQLCRERVELLKRLDETLDQLGEFARAEAMLRRDMQPLLGGSDKFDREQIKGDARTNGLILARLGEFGVGARPQAAVPRLETLGGVHSRIITSIETA